MISAPLLRDDRRDYLGFVSVHDILSALITHMFPPGVAAAHLICDMM